MKKKVFIATVIIFVTGFSVNAQVLVGGNLGLMHHTHEEQGEKSPTSFQFSISPKIGYELNSNFLVGTFLSYSSGTSKEILWGSPNFDKKQSSISFGVGGFGRYSLLKFSKLVLVAEGQIGFRKGSSNIWHRYSGYTEWNTPASESLSTTKFYTNVFPALTYNLTNKLIFDVCFNFFNLGFSSSSTTQKNNSFGSEMKTKDTYFGFKADTFLGSVSNWFDSITVGFYYRF